MQRQLTRPAANLLLWGTVLGLAGLPAHAQQNPPTPPRVVQFSPGGGSYLGIGVQDVDASRAKELKLKEERGVEITAVEDDSPASRAGLRKSDVVLEMNGQRVEGVEQFVRMVRETPVGREVKLTVSRGGDIQAVGAKVAARKSWTINGERAIVLPSLPPLPPNGASAPRVTMPDMPRTYTSWKSGVLGVEAEGLKGGLADFFGVKQGVLVRSVSKGTPAEKAGLRAGDVIVRVNEKPVETPADVAMTMRERGDKKTVTLTVVRDKREMTVTVTLEDEEQGAVMPRSRMVVRAVGSEPEF